VTIRNLSLRHVIEWPCLGILSLSFLIVSNTVLLVLSISVQEVSDGASSLLKSPPPIKKILSDGVWQY
jgi:hypothetical protein